MATASVPGLSVQSLLLLVVMLMAGAVATQVVAATASRVRIRLRVRGPECRSSLSALLSVLGVAIGLASAPAIAHASGPATRREQTTAGPPWSGTSGFPPPRPLVRTGATPHSVTRTHPAIHGTRDKSDVSVRLFPRAAHESKQDLYRQKRAEKLEAMRRHPSATGLPDRSRPPISRTYEVKAGDCLWTIAATVLETDDMSRIARYWPRLHKANRDVIGADPNVIRPGQILRLPGER